MSIRKHNDRVKPGKGIDGTLGERFGKAGDTSQWANHHGGYLIGEIDPASGMPAADENCDIQFSWASRDIFDDVEANSRPRSDDNFGFDATGPIKYGVNRKQEK